MVSKMKIVKKILKRKNLLSWSIIPSKISSNGLSFDQVQWIGMNY